ncbi:MAG: hypothetical protein GXP04_07090 [Alphaproteobacteria bacterium]|nr:hypothetical protein [Marinicaulis sp.]NOX94856.1 hypothetical protein [Alphaproteobacteria bacterium]
MPAEIYTYLESTKPTQGAEYQLALNDPALAFDRPDDIISCKNLSRAQKLQILTQWECDVAILDSQGKTRRAVGNTRLRTRIHNALSSIQCSRGRETISPITSKAF